MDLQTNEIAQFMRGFQPKARAQPKQRGRPRKRTEELFARVIRGHQAIAEWFEQEHGRAARTEIELLRAFREHVRQTSHGNARVVEVLKLDYTLKTVQNLLWEARRYFRDRPGKDPFSGFDSSLSGESNHIIETETTE